MPKACPYVMMKSQRLKHFFGRLLCEYLHFFGRLLCKVRFFIDNYQKLRFFIWDFLGEEMFCFWGRFLGDFITLWVVFFLRNLIFYDEYETCGFDFCADGGGVAVGGSK